MTTIDHQQAAIDAAMPVMRRRDRCPNDSDCLACKAGVGQILAAAAPHLRAAWAEEVRAIDIPEHRLHDQLPSDHWYAGQKAMRDEIAALLEGGTE